MRVGVVHEFKCKNGSLLGGNHLRGRIGLYGRPDWPRSHSDNLKVSDFVAYVQDGKIKEADITGSDVQGTMTEGGIAKPFHTVIPPNYPDIYKMLQDKGVKYTWKESTGSGWIGILFNAVPVLILLGLWIFMMRQMQSGGNKALSFGKSRARLHSSQQKKVTFKDVAGVDEAKEELQEIIEFLREPQKFQKLGGRIPKGVLLIGPPGTGKTLLARAIAGEANVPFFSISGSDFVEMFVGVGASRVRDLFEQGKKNAPCIIFIDEIDAVGRHRGAGLGGGHDEREQTLNQLLVEMDGFESNEGVILVAATNRPDVLDPALLRPGRFDRRVVVDRPDVRGRESILKVHTKKIPLSRRCGSLGNRARDTGFRGRRPGESRQRSGAGGGTAEPESSYAVRFRTRERQSSDGRRAQEHDHQRQRKAHDGLSRRLATRWWRRSSKHADPLHKVTIIPRGMALGLTMQLPLDDKLSHDKKYLESRLAILMAGRIAEEIFLDQMTTGARNDIERATEMARKMVCEWGMSELGPLSFGKKDEQIFLGREIAQHRDYSEETAIRIDEQVRKLVEDAYKRARPIIRGSLGSAGEDRRSSARARSAGWRRSAGSDRGQAVAEARQHFEADANDAGRRHYHRAASMDQCPD